MTLSRRARSSAMCGEATGETIKKCSLCECFEVMIHLKSSKGSILRVVSKISKRKQDVINNELSRPFGVHSRGREALSMCSRQSMPMRNCPTTRVLSYCDNLRTRLLLKERCLREFRILATHGRLMLSIVAGSKTSSAVCCRLILFVVECSRTSNE